MRRAIRRYRRQVGVAGIVFLVLMVTLSGLLYVLPSKAAPHPHAHGPRTLPASGHAVSTTPTTTATSTPTTTASNVTDWPMLGNNPAHTEVNESEQLLSPSTVSGLGLAWSSDVNALCGGCNIVGEPTVAGGVVYVEAYSRGLYLGTLYALSETTGKLLWSYTVTSYLEATPAVVGGVVYINNYVGILFALNATTGKLLWSYDGVNAGVLSSPTVVGGVVYVGATAVNATTGKLLWSYSDIASNGFESSPAVVNGVVYLVSYAGYVYALDATTGTLLWKYDKSFGIQISTSPTVVNGVVYFAWSNLLALNATTGSLLWSYSSGGDGPPAVANGIVYIGGDKLYALDATTGTVVWSVDAGSYAGFGIPSVANGVVYVSSGYSNTGYPGDTLYAINASTGAILWKYTADSSLTPIVANGMVFAVTSGVLYAFHPAIRPLSPA